MTTTETIDILRRLEAFILAKARNNRLYAEQCTAPTLKSAAHGRADAFDAAARILRRKIVELSVDRDPSKDGA